MKIIEWYIFKRAGSAALFTLLALAGVIWIIQVFARVDVVTSSGQSLAAYFRITFLAIPGLLLAVIPISLMLATANTITHFNSNSELVVINASGASNRVIVKPFLVLTFVFSIFTGAVGHYIMPLASTELRSATSSANADLLTIIIREGVFTEIEKGLMFHVGRRNQDGTLSEIVMADDRDAKSSTLVFAKRGTISRQEGRSLLLLEDGEIQQKSVEENTSSIIKFQSYILDIDSMSAKTKEQTRRAKERTTYELFNPDPNDLVYKKRPQDFTIEIHERISEMLWPFANVLLLLAFTAQARSSRQGHGNSVVVASIILLSLRGMGFAAQNAANNNTGAIVFVYILPLSAILFACWYLWHNQLVSLPKRAQDGLDQLSNRAVAIYNQWYQRYLEYRRRKIRYQ